MNNLSEQFDELLAQRSQMLTTYYSFKANVDENAKQLLLCMRLLSKSNAKAGALFTAETADELNTFVNSEHGYSRKALICALQVKLLLHRKLQSSFLSMLMQSEELNIQSLAPELALFISADAHSRLVLALPSKSDEKLYNRYLLSLFYHNQLVAYLTSTKYNAKQLSPLSHLYIKVLSSDYKNSYEVLDLFIKLNYLESPLFEIFIVSLDEQGVTKVVNFFSSNIKLTTYALKCMALSGYSKFIPYLAHSLQQEALSLEAFHGLKLMLGDNLNQFIPQKLQFESDEEQRMKNFPAYGEKIVAAWKSKIAIFKQAKILNGMAIDVSTVDTLLNDASQQHRYFANLHKRILQPNERVNHFEKLFDAQELPS